MCLLQVVPDSAQVEPFYVRGQPFTQLSDHYAVKIVLRYTPPEEAMVAAAAMSSKLATRRTKFSYPNPPDAFGNCM